jgi:hypothetical protein
MIQINVVTETKGGLQIPTGILLDVKVNPMNKVVNGLTVYNIGYDAKIYKDMSEYIAGNVLVNEYMKEYNISYLAENVDIQTLDGVDALLDIYRQVIENGSEGYNGTGVGTTALVYPPTV